MDARAQATGWVAERDGERKGVNERLREAQRVSIIHIHELVAAALLVARQARKIRPSTRDGVGKRGRVFPTAPSLLGGGKKGRLCR